MTGTVAATGRSATFGSGPEASARPQPPPGPAIGHEPTRAALARHGRRTFTVSLAIPAGLIALAVLVGRQPDLGVRIAGAVLGGLLVAAVLAHRWWWMRDVLRTSSWVPRRGDHRVTGFGKYEHALLLVEADEHGPEVLCSVPELRWRTHVLGAEGPIDIWVAGDPRRTAVATVDGSEIVPVRQPRFAWRRKRLCRRLERRGVAVALD